MRVIGKRIALRWCAAMVVTGLGTVVAPAAATMHTGESNCQAALVEKGSTWENACEFPFQGFPIGVAGVYDSQPTDDADTAQKAAEFHGEVLLQPAVGTPQAIGVECDQITKGSARCLVEYNPLGTPLTAPEPVPTEGAALLCKAHSHAKYSRQAPPSGRFACWSTDEARAALEEDGFFEETGNEPGGGQEPAPSPLEPLAGLGLATHVTTVPYNRYAPTTLVVSRTLGLTYTNVDTARHDVVALDARRADGSAPWCADFEDEEDPAAEDCPLFWSPLIGGGGTQTPVLGLEDTVAGQSYEFYCSIHPQMVGTLEVVE